MVPNTICNFSTTGSAYTEFESGISVYYTKDNCEPLSDVSSYATSHSYFHAKDGLEPDEDVCELRFRLRNDSETEMQTVLFYTTGAL